VTGVQTCALPIYNPPVGASAFVTYEGLPTDFYLRLVGEAGKWIHGEKGYNAVMPLKIN
jgi:hypothetical protein